MTEEIRVGKLGAMTGQISLEDLLERAANSATYRLFSQYDIPASNIRELWEGIPEHGNITVMTALPIVDDATLTEIEQWVKIVFADYNTQGYFGVAAASLVSQTFFSSANDIALGLTKAATLLGVPQVMEHLRGWLGGEPIVYTSKALIAGLRIEQPVQLSDSVSLHPVEFDEQRLAPVLPATVTNSFGRYEQPSLTNTVVVSVTRKITKRGPLYKLETQEIEQRLETEEYLAEQAEMEAIYRALSLVFDSAVVPVARWRDYGELLVFNTGTIDVGVMSRRLPHEGYVLLFGGNQISTGELSDVTHLLPKLNTQNLASLGLLQAIDRWMKNKELGYSMTDLGMTDRFIELRIMLELLFLDDAETGELRYRLALRGARLHGKDAEDRREQFRNLRKAYDIGSRAIHSGQVSFKTENLEVLDSGLGIVRKEILERLDEGKRRDWEAITLG